MGTPACAVATTGERQATLVYVYEDDSTFRQVLTEVLREEGLLVTDFKAITHLKEAASRLTPSLIIADSWGASYTSIDAEERAQIAELASIAALILMSGRAWVDRVTADELGIACILAKPLALEHLVSEIGRCLDRAVAVSGLPLELVAP